MDRDVLDGQLEQLWGRAKAEAKAAVTAAPEGHWIAGSEWEVRAIFQRLTHESYQVLLQARADGHAPAAGATFSP